jgi:uncharacterized protein (TIGR03086 family)
MNVVTTYHRSVLDFNRLVQQIGDDQWTARTPCADWDVRSLVNHVVSEQLWTVPLLAGQTIEQVGDQFDGDQLNGEPAAAADRAAKAAIRAAQAPDLLDRDVHLSFGVTPAEEYLYQLLADHVVHGWDLSSAIGADRHIDDQAVRVCASWFAERESIYREAGIIAAPVPVPEPADSQDRLLAAFGRDPHWSA